MRRGLLALVLVAACSGGTPSSSSSPSSSPSSAPSATSSASVSPSGPLLTLVEMPGDGWADIEEGADLMRLFDLCVRMPSVRERETTPDRSLQQPEGLRSVVLTAATAADAARAASAITSMRTSGGCFRTMAQDFFRRASTSSVPTASAAEALPASSVGPSGAGFRVSAEINDRGYTTTLEVSYVLMASGSRLGAALLYGQRTPFPGALRDETLSLFRAKLAAP